MITCTCAIRGPETCPHPAHRTGRGGIAGLDPIAARALAVPQPLGIPADVLIDLVEANARLLASDD